MGDRAGDPSTRMVSEADQLEVERPAVVRSRPPDAWAVWEAWQGGPGQIAAIARQVAANVEDVALDAVSVDLDVGAGHQRIQPEHAETDLAPRYRRSFRRLVITGAGVERAIEVEFDNERVRTPGRGVVLRVWSPDSADAVAIRDAIAIAVDGGRGPLGAAPTRGLSSERSADDALVSAERSYRLSVAGAGFFAAGAVVFLASLLHTLIEPTSSLGRVLFFCLCGDRKVAIGLYLLLVGIATFVAAPQVFPQIEISERSTWARTRGWLFGVVGGTITVGGVVDVIARQLS